MSVQKKTNYLMLCLKIVFHVRDDMKSNKGLKATQYPFSFSISEKLNSRFSSPPAPYCNCKLYISQVISNFLSETTASFVLKKSSRGPMSLPLLFMLTAI